MGIGDWGLGIGDWGLGPIPNPQSPIPNPHDYNYKNGIYKIIYGFAGCLSLISMGLSLYENEDKFNYE